MKRSTGRRAALFAAMTAAGVAGAAAARSEDVRGTIAFADGALVPQGCIELHLEDLAVEDAAQPLVGEACVESDGKSKAISFSAPLPSGSTASPGSQITANLKRSDGWLIARGSARFDAEAPVQITLHTVMY